MKLLKILWDAIGTEFGGRHELYERNYAGNYQNIRLGNLPAAVATGDVDRVRKFIDPSWRSTILTAGLRI